MKSRPGIPMTEEAKKEIDIEESIEEMDLQEEKTRPYAKYLRMKQQSLF